jgi:transcription elongation GreA/GreB family factor
MPLYFTRDGAERLYNQKQELVTRLLSTQRQKGAAAETGGNQWHDNFSFEELSRQEMMLNEQIRAINAKLSEMVVLDRLPFNTSRLRIGFIATLTVDGEHRRLRVGGYEDSDPTLDPPVVSYNAPLVSELMGEEAGFEITINIAGQERHVVLEAINHPAERS